MRVLDRSSVAASAGIRAAVAALAFWGAAPGAETAPPAAAPLVARYVGVYTTPPTTVGEIDPAIKAYRVPDGPLLGNGDLAVAIGGAATAQTFYISKSDLSQATRGVGGLTITFPGAAGDAARYRQEQDLFHAEVRSTIPLAGGDVTMRSWVADDGDLLVTELASTAAAPLTVGLRLWAHARGATSAAGGADGALWATRGIQGLLGVEKTPFTATAAMASRVLGATPVPASDGTGATITVPPGGSVRIVTAVAGGFGVAAAPARDQALALAAAATAPDLAARQEAHAAWWRSYWGKSAIDLHDELVERFYYGALYALGCASRAGAVAPGLAGPWHLDGPICWSNKYTLDYNFMAVWWGVYSSNHAELALPYYDVIRKLIPAGRALAAQHGTSGILFSVNAHAWGGFTDARTLNMKGNASLAALNLMMHYEYTRDQRFLVDEAWPLLSGVAEFWEDNLAWEEAGGRWVIRNSSTREGGDDTNPINELAYVPRIFRFLLAHADLVQGQRMGDVVIAVSAAQRQRWQGYVDHISAFPTLTRDGTTVFKEAENRTTMSLGGAGDNSDVLFHVFPAEALSLGSDPALLRIARDTVAALNPAQGKQSWFQANCFPKIYTQAVRCGYPAQEVMDHFKQLLRGAQAYDDRGDHVQLRANLTIVPPVHAFESVGAIEWIDSMLLQSHDGVIRVFPDWIAGQDASFTDLRAHGAFLVSSALRGGRIAQVDITSTVGGDCALAEPWPGRAALVEELAGADRAPIAARNSGGVMVFATVRGRRYRVTAAP